MGGIGIEVGIVGSLTAQVVVHLGGIVAGVGGIALGEEAVGLVDEVVGLAIFAGLIGVPGVDDLGLGVGDGREA